MSRLTTAVDSSLVVTHNWRAIRIDRGDHKMRLDRVLLRHLKDEAGVSRNRVQQWIDAGHVLVNGTLAPRAAWKVQPGDALLVRIAPRRLRSRPAAEPMALDVLYEDDDVLAINKPAGLVVHPSFGHATGTLINGVLARAQSWPHGSKPSLLGRLDKYTSGVVLLTKRPALHAVLQQTMATRRIEKDYIAIVWGKPSPGRGSIDLALDRDPWDRRRITVTDRGGQPSVTKYQRLATAASPTASSSAFSIVRCRLITGRMHQIRVHLAAKGWPIVGDGVYGRKVAREFGAEVEAARQFHRQALHAWGLTLSHPVTGRELSIVAPPPDDMQALAETLGLPRL